MEDFIDNLTTTVEERSMHISGFMFLVACIVVAIYVVRRLRKRAAEAHVKTKQDMQDVKVSCDARVRTLDADIKQLGERLAAARPNIFEDEYREIHEEFDGFVAREHLVTRQYDEYVGQNRAALNTEQKTHVYADMAADFSTFVEDFEAASAAYQAVVKRLNAALLPEKTSRVAHARSATKIAEAQEAIEQAKVSRYRVSVAEGYIQLARRAREKCETNLAAKNYDAFATNNLACSTNAILASESVQRVVWLQIRLAEVSRREAKITELVEAGSDVLQRMSVSFAESSWVSIATNVTQAQGHLEGTKTHVARLQALVDQVDLKQEEVEKLFGEIDLAHEQAKSLIRDLNTLDKRIRGCKVELESSLASASARIQELHDFARGCLMGADLVKAQEDERKARASLVAAKIEAQKEKPDFIAALNHSESAYHIAHHAIQQIQEKRQASADVPLAVAK